MALFWIYRTTQNRSNRVDGFSLPPSTQTIIFTYFNTLIHGDCRYRRPSVWIMLTVWLCYSNETNKKTDLSLGSCVSRLKDQSYVYTLTSVTYICRPKIIRKIKNLRNRGVVWEIFKTRWRPCRRPNAWSTIRPGNRINTAAGRLHHDGQCRGMVCLHVNLIVQRSAKQR